MADSHPTQPTLLDVHGEDPLPPEPVVVEMHVAVDLHFRCDLGAFAAAHAGTLTGYAFLARLDREGFDQIDRIDVLIHEHIDHGLAEALSRIAGVDPQSVTVELEGHTRIDEATARRAEKALKVRYPKRFVGD
jgi:hypothetical protein